LNFVTGPFLLAFVKTFILHLPVLVYIYGVITCLSTGCAELDCKEL
jgi:hypothetical protein